MAEVTQAAVDFIASQAESNSFYESLAKQYSSRGTLPERQLECVVRDMVKQPKEPELTPASKPLEPSKLFDIFESAKKNNLAYPRLSCKGMKISLAGPNSRNAGSLYVKFDGVYAGIIHKDGWEPSNNLDNFQLESLAEHLHRLCADPLEYLKFTGVETGICCCCGRLLTNKTSVALGIGPICAENWGFNSLTGLF